MSWENIVNEDELKKTISVLKPQHQLFEIRILGTDKRKILSGYFTDSDTLIKAFDTVDLRNVNVYITLNAVNEALYSRSQHDKFVANTNTTSDTEIDSYQWLFIDFDPVRPTNISSSESELKLAFELKEKVKAYLAEMGFSAPVQALSGNGYHLLYKIDLINTNENIQLVSDCLTALATIFNTDKVKVDTTNCNPSRICKLHGTLAQKGANTNSRPHRMSRLVDVPEIIEVTPKELLQKIADELPKESKVTTTTAKYSSPQFDIKSWMSNYGLTYKEDVGRDCRMYLLDECPFDSNHKNGDAKIFEYSNGAIAFKCHHNSCKDKYWQDVREKFEPGIYEKKDSDARIEAGYTLHKQEKENDIFIPLEDNETGKAKPKKKKIRKLKTAEALMSKDIEEPEVFIGVGQEIPLLVEGTCILSAKPKLGKSWLVLAMCLAICKGEDFLGYKTKKCSTLYLDLETSEQLQQKRIRKALNGSEVPTNFYLDTETDSLDSGFVEQIEAYMEEDPNIGVVVIDVFQIIRSSAKNSKENEYEHAYRDITPLNELAKKYHISIVLVCHDRKMVDLDDPFANILGSTGLQGAVSQMMVMFKTRKDLPIHLSVKGKTIDGIIDMNIALNKGQWSTISEIKADGSEDLEYEYNNSSIRKVAIILSKRDGGFRGRCSQIIEEAAKEGIGIKEDALGVGKFIHKFIGYFPDDDVLVEIIKNGSGAQQYKISRLPLITVDEDTTNPFI